jgi:Superfamily II DNA and RNA helicases
VYGRGKYYYEATVTDEGLCRVGWSTSQAVRDLGTDRFGFGFGGTGKKSNNKQFDNYGEAFGMHDVIGCLLDLDNMTVAFTKNGQHLGLAFNISQQLKNSAFYPAVVLKNAEMSFNFGATPFKHEPPKDYIAVCNAPKQNVKHSESADVSAGPVKLVNNAPQAIIIEPSRELAEQTFNQIIKFKKFITDPKVMFSLKFIFKAKFWSYM